LWQEKGHPVEIIELAGAPHREILEDQNFIDILLDYACGQRKHHSITLERPEHIPTPTPKWTPAIHRNALCHSAPAVHVCSALAEVREQANLNHHSPPPQVYGLASSSTSALYSFTLPSSDQVSSLYAGGYPVSYQESSLYAEPSSASNQVSSLYTVPGARMLEQSEMIPALNPLYLDSSTAIIPAPAREYYPETPQRTSSAEVLVYSAGANADGQAYVYQVYQ
jgi:hypothetical protein